MPEKQSPPNKNEFTVKKLSKSQLDDLKEILIELDPWGKRNLFLGNISNRVIVSRLTTSNIPIDQLSLDLISLNKFGRLTDDSIPFQEYLKGIASCYSWSPKAYQIRRYADSLTPKQSSDCTYKRRDQRQKILRYYVTKDELRILSSDIGLEVSKINFSGCAENIANSLLSEAEKCNKVHLINEKIKEDYG